MVLRHAHTQRQSCLHLLVIALLCYLTGCAAMTKAHDQTSTPPAVGLSVQNGQFMRAGKPYRGVGINYMSAFLRVIGSADAQAVDTSYREGFAVLRQYDVPFIRFCANGFWPSQWKLYTEQPERYFALMDTFVQDAERCGLGLIPCFFWKFSTLPDLTGEPLDQWGNPDSKTIALMQQFTRQFVERYKNSPAIWGYEFGNEYMLEADLPGYGQMIAKLIAENTQGELGLPAQRTEHDVMRRDDIRRAYKIFAQTIRTLDANRAIFTGDSLPRCSSYHLYHEGSWELDTTEQWLEVFVRDNPDPIDTLSIHHYYWGGEYRQEYGPHGQDLTQAMQTMQQAAREVGKPLFVGEFGFQSNLESVEERKAQFFETLKAIEQCGVQLSASWVFDFPHQPDNNVTPQTENAFVLDALKQVNARMASLP